MQIEDIMQRVAANKTRHVTVTGGEPLAQKACIDLLSRLCEADYEVSLETSGAMDISAVDQRVSRVMDIKTPASGEVDRNNWNNIEVLTAHDQIKFVICNRDDYEWSVSMVNKYNLTQKCEVLFSPSYTQLPIRDLAEWVLHDGLDVRVQVQLHKLIWGDQPGK